MPLPLGHAALGLAGYEIMSAKQTARGSRWAVVSAFILLANLPDIDVVAGLLVFGNGNILHRGPTHSLLFALVIGFFAAQSWRLGHLFPKLSFMTSFTLILSHILADWFLTAAPVSILWPYQLHQTHGHQGVWDVIQMACSPGLIDAGLLALACALVLKRRYPWKLWTLGKPVQAIRHTGTG